MEDDGVTQSAHTPDAARAPDGQRSPGPLQALLDLQAHDLALDRLAYRLRELPERARLDELDRQRAQLSRRLEVVEANRAELARQQDELDGHVQALVSRIAVIEARLRSGTAGSYRDQEAMANETRSLDQQRRDYEDRELDIMEQLEPVETELASVASDLARIDAERADASSQLAAGEATIAVERSEVVAEREPLAALLPPELAISYERLRAKLGGIGAAKLVDGACSGCHLRLPSRERDEVVHAPQGTVFYCDQCGRILVP
ncbi:MAG: C4-type zinc ribbon domain-containing protein [Acidimicrobiales bacterium]|jgi:predicted  nucleic acid-binding Zn-ribbon protein